MLMARPVAGVMGPGEDATDADKANAFALGQLLAQAGWVVLSGGRDAGVMREVNRGARAAGGLTIGILPDASARVSPDVDVAVVTGMHNARNNINVLSSHVVIACGDGGPGTVSEVALALKAGKPVILLGASELSRAFFGRLARGPLSFVASAAEAVAAADRYKPGQPG
jgi:uncharacterized protein (TIGR00725 family)